MQAGLRAQYAKWAQSSLMPARLGSLPCHAGLRVHHSGWARSSPCYSGSELYAWLARSSSCQGNFELIMPQWAWNLLCQLGSELNVPDGHAESMCQTRARS